MKLLLLSLLPLAVNLAAARPALQEGSAALTRRTSPVPQPQERPEDSDSVKSTPDETSLWQFSEQPGFDYSQDLAVDFPTDAAGRFLGLDEDEVADLQSIFTDDKKFDVAIRPGASIPDAYEFSTAFLPEPSSDDTDGSVIEDDQKPVEDKGAEKSTDFKTYRPDFPLPDSAPTFDAIDTDIFDEDGLPTKVVFSPNEDYSQKLDIPAPAVTPDPQRDYGQFIASPTSPQ